VRANSNYRIAATNSPGNEMASRSKFTGLEHPVFPSSTGRPVDAHNIFNRVLKSIGAKLGMPWLGWHVFWHSYASWVRQEAASPTDQMAMPGYSDIRMTMHYGQQDLERHRAIVEQMSAKLASRVAGSSPAAPTRLQRLIGLRQNRPRARLIRIRSDRVGGLPERYFLHLRRRSGSEP
jgi:hypothetical protein